MKETRSIKWGLGIEHEVRLRFQKNIYEFSNEFSSKFFPQELVRTLKDTSGYIFLNSYQLLYFFRKCEVFQLKHFFQYAKTDKEKEYANEIVILYDLYKKAKNGERYPLQNPLYFKRETDIHTFSNNFKKIKFYIEMYSLYHYPLLFFNIHHSEQPRNNILLESIWDYLFELENIDDNSVYSQFSNNFEKLYNGEFNEEYKDKLMTLINENLIGNCTVDFYTDDISDNVELIIRLEGVQYNNSGIMKRLELSDITKLESIWVRVIKNMIENTKMDLLKNEKEEVLKNLYYMYAYNVPEIDWSAESTMLEFITKNYKSLSFENAHKELMNFENSFFKLIESIPVFKKFVNVFGGITYHNNGSISSSIEVYDIVSFDFKLLNEDYTGSYHIWITPPYRPDTSVKTFAEECATLANKFQLIEPLIAAHFTSPSYSIIGDEGKLARTSYRQFIGKFSNYGTADTSFLMGTPTHKITKYYLNEDDLINSVKGGTSNAIYAYFEGPVYRKDGKQVFNYDKLEQRFLTSKIYEKYSMGNSNSHPPQNLRDYYSLVFEKSKIRPLENTLQLGPDVRTKMYPELMYPLDEEWKREYYLKDGKIIEVYVNYYTQEISFVPVYDKEEYKKLKNSERIGIELRVFDHFPTVQLEQILRILACLDYQSYLKHYKVTAENMYIHQQWWHDEMSKVILNGFEYKPSYTYLKNISKEFGLSELRLNKDIKNQYKEEKETYTEIVLSKIYRRLNSKYTNSELYRKLQFGKKTKVIDFKNLNKKAWFDIFTFYLLQNPDIHKKLWDKSKLNNKNIMENLGNKYKQNIQRIKNYFENIHKKNKNKNKNNKN